MKLFLISVLFVCWGSCFAQIPVEVIGGHKKATADIMFFNYFNNKEKQHSNWLLFNRNRVSVDYKMSATTNLPLFGFTEAISYNDKLLKGFAPVAVVQLNSKGVYPKIGVQFAKIKTDLTIFTWLVGELLQHPTVDFFFLGRYTPKLTAKLRLFTQIELLTAFPTLKTNNFTFIQRARVGLKINQFQLGAGADFTAIGRNNFTTTQNIGPFIRYEF